MCASIRSSVWWKIGRIARSAELFPATRSSPRLRRRTLRHRRFAQHDLTRRHQTTPLGIGPRNVGRSCRAARSDPAPRAPSSRAVSFSRSRPSFKEVRQLNGACSADLHAASRVIAVSRPVITAAASRIMSCTIAAAPIICLVRPTDSPANRLISSKSPVALLVGGNPGLPQVLGSPRHASIFRVCL
jgi:hypothetical protein